MFEIIVSKITKAIRSVVNTVGVALNRAPWLSPAIFLLLLVGPR